MTSNVSIFQKKGISLSILTFTTLMCFLVFESHAGPIPGNPAPESYASSDPTEGNKALTAAEPAWVDLIPAQKVIEWRRHIHQHPEVSFEETNTSDYVASVLESFGNIEITRPTDTSVLGILQGAHPGRTVAFRADMDALPVQEETGVPYASTVPGVMHACGHDTHTAMLLGTAATFSKLQDQVKGTIYFLFQHAEEQHPGGARDIIATGVLDEVDAFFGLHVLPNYPVGHVGILPDGAASTAADSFSLSIQGKGSHGSMPHLGVDPIVIGAEIVGGLQSIVSRNTPPGEMAVLSIGTFKAGDAPNVIADKAELAGTVRTTTPETRKLIQERTESIVENLTRAYNAYYDLDYEKSYPAIINDPSLNELTRTSAISILGEDKVFDAEMMTASEDFAYYAQLAPVSYFALGIGDGVANHHPKFNPDERAFINGVKVQVQLLLDYLNQPETA